MADTVRPFSRAHQFAAATISVALIASCGARTSLDVAGTIGGDSAAPVATSDAASPPPACTPLTSDAGACNDLQPSGAAIPVLCEQGPAPSPSGGDIVDGTYVLEASHFYGGCPTPGEVDRIVWFICGTSWATVQEATQPATGIPTVLRLDGSANVTAAPPMVDVALVCAPPGTPGGRFGYDATPTSLTLYVYAYGGGSVRVDRFSRTP
jgi:hypothetical protein